MPRVREFDPTLALADAMQIFWRNGYADTSMEDIVSETGVSRYGLYGTFGNKKELLIAAIRHYEQTMCGVLMSALRQPNAGRAEIIEHWETLAEFAKDKAFCDGCLIVNVAAEVAPHDPDVAAEVLRIDREHTEVYANAIRNGQAQGDIPLDIDPHAVGLLFVSMERGLALMTRAGTSPAELFPAVTAALYLLDGSRSQG